MDGRDYEELLETLKLNAYQNVELSTLKFMETYPEVMKKYDIRDQYELHNLLRKIVIVVPLTLFLPLIPSLGVSGVFLAEPISNFLGASASYLAMMFYLKKLLIRSVPEREV